MRSVKITPWITVSSSLHKDVLDAVKEAQTLAFLYCNALMSINHNNGYSQAKCECVKIESFATKSDDGSAFKRRYWVANALLLNTLGPKTENNEQY